MAKNNLNNNIAEVIYEKIKNIQKTNSHIIGAIDGRCASGKTTAAESLKKLCDCNVIHMDHFFLQPEQRNEKRLNEPGGNVDYERFFKEVLTPLEKGKNFSYCPYDCHKQILRDPIHIELKDINIIEGSYSCHPFLSRFYDFKIFMTIDKNQQAERIKKRNGEEGYIVFKEKWIPLEEKYFSDFNIERECDMCFDTGEGIIKKE